MLRVIEACTKSGGAAHSGSDARQAQRAGIVRWRVGAVFTSVEAVKEDWRAILHACARWRNIHGSFFWRIYCQIS